MEHFKNKVLTIAGSDSGAGAGIQADLKTFAALGVYGVSVLTAVTAQNSIGVQDVRIMDEDIINSQIDSVLSDIGASAVKTGMLANSNIIKLVSKKIKEYKIQNLIVDPVMVSESGDALLEEDAVSSYVQDIIPISVLVTPNILEAENIDIKQNPFYFFQQFHELLTQQLALQLNPDFCRKISNLQVLILYIELQIEDLQYSHHQLTLTPHLAL